MAIERDDLLKLRLGAAAPGGLRPPPVAPPPGPLGLNSSLSDLQRSADSGGQSRLDLPTFDTSLTGGAAFNRPWAGGRRDPNMRGVFSPLTEAVAQGTAQGRAYQGGGRYGGQALVRGIDNAQLGTSDAVTQNAVNMPGATSGGQALVRGIDNAQLGADAGYRPPGASSEIAGPPPPPTNYAADFTGRDAIRGSLTGRPTTPGTQITSNYGYGDNITATADSKGRFNSFSNIGSPEVGRTTPAGAVGGALQTGLVQSQYNTNPVGVGALSPGLGGELHAARLAAVGRGESLGGGTVEGYNDGGSSAAIGSLQDKLAVMDRDISSARDGTLVGNWKAGKLARDRDGIAARGAQLIGEQNAVNTGRNYAANTQSVANTAAMHDATLRRSAELGYGANMAHVGAQVRGQDRSAETALMQDATHRADAKMRNDLGIANVGVHQRQNEINAAIHGPAAQMEALRLRYAQAGDMDSLEALSKAMGKMHEGSGQYSPTKDLMGEVTGNFDKRGGVATKFMTPAEFAAQEAARRLQPK